MTVKQNLHCLTNVLKNFLFPNFCALCGINLYSSDDIFYGLCRNCRSFLNPETGKKCSICGKPLFSEIDLCLSCRKISNENEPEIKTYDRLWKIYPYTGKYRKLLTSYKFKKNITLAAFFSEKIMEVININPELKEAVIVPVPPRPGKIKDIGWDQVNTIIKRLEKTKDIKVSRCLKRRKSKVQKILNRTERLENLKGRIYLNGQVPEKVLIIDDVITTGSTMEVCSQVLKEGGVKKVYGLCLFYD